MPRNQKGSQSWIHLCDSDKLLAVMRIAPTLALLALLPAVSLAHAKDAPEQDKKPQKSKDKVTIPKFDMPKLDPPKVDGIKAAPTDDPYQATQGERRSDGPPFQVKKLIHAYGFSGGNARPCVPHKAYVGFALHHFPDAV